MSREINQQAIADRLGISRATVSRCFTGHAGISPVTRARVFQLAAEMGYTHMETRAPSSVKKKGKRSKLFNVLICTDRDEYLHGGYQNPGEQVLAGVSEFALNNGARVEVSFIPPTVTSLDDAAFREIGGLSRRAGTGVLLIYPFPTQVIEELTLKFPLVSLVEQTDHRGFDCVDVDHSSGMAKVVGHLLEKGHSRIGFYTRGYQVAATWSFRRYSAFVERMARHRLKVRAADIIGMFPRPETSVEESLDIAAERSRNGVTAWICAADHQAFDLIAGLQRRGLSVPDDVSVTGFDGLEKKKGQPDLTTVQIPFRDIGMTGAERLASRLDKRFHGRRHVSIDGMLHEGKTVARPKFL